MSYWQPRARSALAPPLIIVPPTRRHGLLTERALLSPRPGPLVLHRRRAPPLACPPGLKVLDFFCSLTPTKRRNGRLLIHVPPVLFFLSTPYFFDQEFTVFFR